jgi:hypothetical protein
LGQVTGRITFEIAATFVPVAGVAGKLSKAGKIADAGADALRAADTVGDGARVVDVAASKLDELGKILDGARPRGGFDALLRSAKLSVDDLSLLARAGKLSATEISDVVLHLGVKTPQDQLVLWSGLGLKGKDRAAAFATEAGGMTLEMTKGGKWLDDLKLFEGGAPNIDRVEVRQIWQRASEQVARQASGLVRVVRGQISPSSIYSMIERPALLNNPKVLGIDEIPLKPTLGAADR